MYRYKVSKYHSIFLTQKITPCTNLCKIWQKIDKKFPRILSYRSFGPSKKTTSIVIFANRNSPITLRTSTCIISIHLMSLVNHHHNALNLDVIQYESYFTCKNVGQCYIYFLYIFFGDNNVYAWSRLHTGKSQSNGEII